MGCSDDNDLFSGQDNYLISFALEKDGVSYPAAISGNDITITVPANIDLQGATAKFTISELASIQPDPATVTEWNNTQQFLITAWNQAERNYTCSVSQTSMTESGTVVLKTQAEVDAFASTGISHIDGHLIIGEANAYAGLDTIKNLNGLAGLIEISGNLVIKNSFGGTSLEGLSKLESAGNIYIGTASASMETLDTLNVVLAKFTSLGELVINDNKVRQISFPALQSAWSVFVNGKSVAALAFPALKNVYGNLTLQSGQNASGSTANTVLTSIDLSALERVPGSLTLQGLTALETLGLPKLGYVGNDFILSYLSKVASVDLSALEQVEGKISVSYQYACEAFAAEKLNYAGGFLFTGDYSNRPAKNISLPALERVSGDFEIDYTSLETLSLPALQSIEGQFKLDRVESLARLELPELNSCPGVYLSYVNLLPELDLSSVQDLASFQLIRANVLETIKMPATVQDITLNGGNSATLVPVFDGLEEITGTLSVTNYKLADVAFPNIKRIGTYSQTSGSAQKTLTFADLESIESLKLSLTALTTLSAPKLARIGTLDFSSMWKLEQVDWPLLEEITGEMKIWGATYSAGAAYCEMANLDGFSSVSKIGSVNIKWCGALVNYSGLENALPALSADQWSVTGCKYNPTFQDMLDGRYAE